MDHSVVLKLQVVNPHFVRKTVQQTQQNLWIITAYLSTHGLPASHLFEPEGEREADDAGGRDRVEARAKVTGLVLEHAKQVGKTERAQIGEKVSEARQRPHQPGAVPFQRQSEDRSEVKLHEHGVDHYQAD